MAYQLIFTSSPSSLIAGRSGFSTVARTADMPELLANAVERCGTFESDTVSGAVYSHRKLNCLGRVWHVLTRAQEAGVDYTGRNNYIAHHIVVSEAEIQFLPNPAEILACYSGWCLSWSGEPRFIDAPDLCFTAIPPRLPAQTWRELFSDAGAASVMLSQTSEIGVGRSDADLALRLFAESIALVRNPLDAWEITFTTRFFSSENPADFIWRGVQSNSRLEGKLKADISSRTCIAILENRAAEYARTGELNNREKYKLTVGEPIKGTRKFNVVSQEEKPKPNIALWAIVAMLSIVAFIVVFYAVSQLGETQEPEQALPTLKSNF